MFVASASRLQRPYGAREKSIFRYSCYGKALRGGHGCSTRFRTDNGVECSNGMLVDDLNSLGIRRVFTAPLTSQQNRPVVSEISRTFKAGHVVRQGVPLLFPDVRLEETLGCMDRSVSTGRPSQ